MLRSCLSIALVLTLRSRVTDFFNVRFAALQKLWLILNSMLHIPSVIYRKIKVFCRIMVLVELGVARWIRL